MVNSTPPKTSLGISVGADVFLFMVTCFSFLGCGFALSVVLLVGCTRSSQLVTPFLFTFKLTFKPSKTILATLISLLNSGKSSKRTSIWFMSNMRLCPKPSAAVKPTLLSCKPTHGKIDNLISPSIIKSRPVFCFTTFCISCL